MRTVGRDTRSTRAISCLLTPFALSSRIALRCAWLSLFRFLFLSDSFRHPVQFPARAFDLALRLLPLCRIHLRQCFAESAAGAAHNGQRHLQIPLDLFDRFRHRCCRLPLRFQKQCRFSENALANHARTFAPRGIKLRGLPCIATVLHEYGGHALTAVRADPRDRHQIFHRDLRGKIPIAHLPRRG